MPRPLSRRDLIKSAPLAAAGLAAGCASAQDVSRGGDAVAESAEPRRWQDGASPWPICLDSATIRPSPLEAKIRMAAAAGYDAFEPWEGELHEYEQQGGDLEGLGRRIRDVGMFVPSVIGLWSAIPPTREAFDAQMEHTRRRMRQAAAVGAEFVQLVPQPARPWTEFDPKWAADRYRELLEIGINDYNIKPSVVFVEFLEGVRRMGQAAAIAIDADHLDATIIPDVFHMLIGGSGFNGLRHLRGDFFSIFQFNDAPAEPAKYQLEDRHRVYPGDGILPLTDILRDLKATGFSRCVSLELYNPGYWEQDHLTVAQTGLDKTLGVIRAAGV